MSDPIIPQRYDNATVSRTDGGYEVITPQLRETLNAFMQGRPPRPANQLPDVVPSSGPQSPDAFHWRGHSVYYLSKQEFTLLELLWDFRTAAPLCSVPVKEVLKQVCQKARDPHEALRGAVKRLNQKLAEAGISLTLSYLRNTLRLKSI
jgi:hypothetical protein